MFLNSNLFLMKLFRAKPHCPLSARSLSAASLGVKRNGVASFDFAGDLFFTMWSVGVWPVMLSQIGHILITSVCID